MALIPIEPIEAAPPIPDPENRLTFSSLMYGLLRWITDKMAPGVQAAAEATNNNAAEALAAASSAQGAAIAAANLESLALGHKNAASSSASTASTAASTATTQATAAQNWATKEGSPVSGGLYSSKHYAGVAEAAAAAYDDTYLLAWLGVGESDKDIVLATPLNDGLMASEDKAKLDGIDDGATSNATDAYLLSRANHTGTQATSTISGLDTALAGKLSTSGGTMTGPINNSPQHRTAATELTGTTLDLAAGTDFYKTISANTTITLSNVSAASGLAQAAMLIVKHTGGTITFAGATFKWSGGAAPTFITGRTYKVIFWPDPIDNQVLISAEAHF